MASPALADFTTADLPPCEGKHAWQRYMSETYPGIDVTPRKGWNVGTIRRVRIGPIEISAVSADAQQVSRLAKGSSSAASEDMVLVFPRGHPIDVRQDGISSTVTPGDAFLLNTTRRYEGSGPHGTGYLTFKLPADLLRERIGGIDDLCARANVVNREMSSVVEQFGQSVIHTPLDASLADRLGPACVDLITVLVDAAGRDGARQSSQAHRFSLVDLRAYIDRHLGDPDLSIRSAASACGLSVRVAQKRFQQVDTTFCRELLARRLDQADRLLRHSDRAIGLVAARCGFVSQSHFSAVYRQRFGRSPKQTRREPTD